MRTRQQDLRSNPGIRPAAAVPRGTGVVRLPTPQVDALEGLAPLSQTIGRVFNQLKDRDVEGKRAKGTAAFGLLEEDAAKALRDGNLADFRKLIKAGASPLSTPHALESYHRDVGLFLAGRGAARVQEKADTDGRITSVVDENGNPVRPPDPLTVYGESTKDLDELVSGLHPEVLTGYETGRRAYQEQFVNNTLTRQGEAREKHNYTVKVSKYYGELQRLLEDPAEITPESLVRLAGMDATDYEEGFTRGREALTEAITKSMKYIDEKDNPARALELNDALRELRIGGQLLGEDPTVNPILEELEDRYERTLELQEDERYKRQARAQQDAVDQGREEFIGEVRAVRGSPVAVQRKLAEIEARIKLDPKYRGNEQSVLEYLNRASSLYEQEVELTDRATFGKLAVLIDDADPDAFDKIQQAEDNGLLSPEDTLRLKQSYRQRQDESPYRGSFEPYQELKRQLVLDLDPDGFSPDAKNSMVDFNESIQRDASALWSDAIQEAKIQVSSGQDPTIFLRQKSYEIIDELKGRKREFEADIRTRRDILEQTIQEQGDRHLDTTEHIEQGYNEGLFNLDRLNELRQINIQNTDHERLFFEDPSYLRAEQDLMRALQSSDLPSISEHYEDLTMSGPTASSLAIEERVLKDLRERSQAWLDENLATTNAQSQRGAWKEHLRATLDEFRGTVLSPSAQAATATPEEAEAFSALQPRLEEAKSALAADKKTFSKLFTWDPAFADALGSKFDLGSTPTPAGVSIPTISWNPYSGGDYTKELTDYVNGDGSLPQVQKAFFDSASVFLDRGAVEEVVAEDGTVLNNKEKTLIREAASSQIRPEHVLSGVFKMDPPSYLLGSRRGVTRLGTVRPYSTPISVKFDPKTDINPFQTPLWMNAKKLEAAVSDEKQLNAITEALGVPPTMRDIFVNAQRTLTSKFPQ